MAHNHNGNRGGCNQADCDCDDSNAVISREIIENNPSFCVLVSGDYEADQDDEVIHVKAGSLDANGIVIVPTITLADPDDVDHDAAHVTIVAQGGDVRVTNLNDAAAVNVNGQPSNGTRIVAGGSAVTFWLTDDDGECSCNDAANYWIAECCGELATASRAG